MQNKKLEKNIEKVKTALDLTVEEWQAYYPGKISDKPLESAVKKRRQEAWQTARRAARILHNRFSADKVVVFGSLASGKWFSLWSDIDLAAWGIPPDSFYLAVAVITGLSADFKVDLIDPETCRLSVRKALEEEGIEL